MALFSLFTPIIQTQPFNKVLIDNKADWSDFRENVFRLNSNDLSQLPAPWVYGWSGAFSCFVSEFKNVGGFDESFKGWGAEDTDLSYRLFLRGNKFISSSETSVIHYPHLSKNKDISQGYLKNRERLFEKNPSLESELYLKITGVNLNNVATMLENLSINSISPIYEHQGI